MEIIVYILIINLIAFFAMYIDKQKSIKKKWRISEKTLIIFSIMGGSIGMLLGMNLFRHKTKHKLFTVGVPLILIIQLLITFYIVFNI